MFTLSPGDTWDLTIEECPTCGAAPVQVIPEGDDDYLLDCGTCTYKIRIASDTGEDGIVTDILQVSSECRCDCCERAAAEAGAPR